LTGGQSAPGQRFDFHDVGRSEIRVLSQVVQALFECRQGRRLAPTLLNAAAQGGHRSVQVVGASHGCGSGGVMSN
jgi:hypothetical protein